MSSKQCIYTVSNMKHHNLLDSSSVSNCCSRCAAHDDILSKTAAEHRSDMLSRLSAPHRPNSRNVSLQNSLLSQHTSNGYGYHSKQRSHRPPSDYTVRSDRSQTSINDLKNLRVDKCSDSLVDSKEVVSGYDYNIKPESPRKSEVSCDDNCSVSSAHRTVNGIISKTLLTLCLVCIACLIMALLAFQLILSLSQPLAHQASSLVKTLDNRSDLHEVTVAIVTLVVTLDLGCLIVCSMQCFYVAKVMQLADGDYRSLVYLKQCAGTRFIAVFSFFASIPAFFIGLLLCIGASVQSTYQWRVAKNRADHDRTLSNSSRNMKLCALNQFSTLV